MKNESKLSTGLPPLLILLFSSQFPTHKTVLPSKWKSKTKINGNHYFLHIGPILTYFRAVFYDKKMGEEIDGGLLGEQYNGYVFKITGGQDMQGFAMIQGVF